MHTTSLAQELPNRASNTESASLLDGALTFKGPKAHTLLFQPLGLSSVRFLVTKCLIAVDVTQIARNLPVSGHISSSNIARGEL